jgi:hypothetical protein
LPEIKENYEFAKKYWYQKSRHLNQKPLEEESSSFPDPFFFDVTKSQIRQVEELFSEKPFSIVTEGYLGKNYSYLPSFEEFNEQLESVYSIWEKFLKKISQSHVKELIFCIPAIKSGNPSVSFRKFEALLRKYNFRAVNLIRNEKFIIYQRPKTIVAHQIIMAQKT